MHCNIFSVFFFVRIDLGVTELDYLGDEFIKKNYYLKIMFTRRKKVIFRMHKLCAVLNFQCNFKTRNEDNIREFLTCTLSMNRNIL